MLDHACARAQRRQTRSSRAIFDITPQLAETVSSTIGVLDQPAWAPWPP